MFALQYALDADGASSRDVALVFGIYTLSYAVIAPLFGRFSDGRGRRWSVLAGSLLFACAAGATGALLELHPGADGLTVSTPSSFLGVRGVAYSGVALLAVANALFWPAFQARIGDRERDPAALSHAILFFNIGWTSGKALGFLVAGLLFKAAPSACVPAGAACGALAFFILLMGERTGAATPTAPASDPTPPAPSPSPTPQGVKRRFLVAALIANLVLWGSLATLKALAPKLGESLGVGAREVGAILFVALAAQALGFWRLGAAGRYSAGAYRAGALCAAIPAALAGLVAVYGAGHATSGIGLVAALCGAVFLGLAQAVTYTSSVTYSLDYDERRGLRTGIHEAVLAVGGGLPILGGELADRTGNLQAPILLMLGIGLVGAFLVLALLLRKRAGSQSEC